MNTPPPTSAYQQPLPVKKTNWAIIILIVVGVMCFFCIILAAILFPVFSQAKVAAKRSSCMSNVKLLSTATLVYSADFDDRLPVASIWMDSINTSNYLSSSIEPTKRIFRCPALGTASSSDSFGYAFNDEAKGSMNEIPDPKALPIIFDSTSLEWNAHGTTSLLPVPSRHISNMVGFADGHVKGYKPGTPIP